MLKRYKIYPAVIWQLLLMGLLGLSGIIFIPILLPRVNVQLMANVLVAQVFIYYLVLLAQYGAVISGPAAMANATDAGGKAQVWQNVMRSKRLMSLPVALLFGFAFVIFSWGQWYLLWFALLVAAFAVNSNWFLQAQQNFAVGAAFAAFGVGLSFCMLWMLPPDGGWVVLILAMPQICLGFGTWWHVRKTCLGFTLTKFSWRESFGLLRKDAPLVVSQLLLLASTTFGTVVIGMLADAETSTAYAATEKLFNLGATIINGIYMALYPKFADWFYSDRSIYWIKTKLLLLTSVVGGMLLAMLLFTTGGELMSLYLPKRLVPLIAPTLPVFAVWLGICLNQHVLTSYLILAERQRHVFWVNACVFIVTVIVGYVLTLSSQLGWIYGMVTGQIFSFIFLCKLYIKDNVLHS